MECHQMDTSAPFRFSIGPLPHWAQREIVALNGSDQQQNVSHLRGRWAQRADASCTGRSKSTTTIDDDVKNALSRFLLPTISSKNKTKSTHDISSTEFSNDNETVIKTSKSMTTLSSKNESLPTLGSKNKMKSEHELTKQDSPQRRFRSNSVRYSSQLKLLRNKMNKVDDNNLNEKSRILQSTISSRNKRKSRCRSLSPPNSESSENDNNNELKKEKNSSPPKEEIIKNTKTTSMKQYQNKEMANENNNNVQSKAKQQSKSFGPIEKIEQKYYEDLSNISVNTSFQNCGIDEKAGSYIPCRIPSTLEQKVPDSPCVTKPEEASRITVSVVAKETLLPDSPNISSLQTSTAETCFDEEFESPETPEKDTSVHNSNIIDHIWQSLIYVAICLYAYLYIKFYAFFFP